MTMEIDEQQFVKCLNHFKISDIEVENDLIDPYEPICKIFITYYQDGKPVLEHEMRSTGKCETESFNLLDKNYYVEE